MRTSGPSRKRVLVFGTFDLLHAGHRSLLRQARQHGDELIVAVARDAVVQRIKGKRPVHREYQRVANLRALGVADRVVLARKNPAERFDFIRRLQPKVICLGYDQTTYAEGLATALHSHGLRIRVVRLKPFQPDRFKSSLLRRKKYTKS